MIRAVTLIAVLAAVLPPATSSSVATPVLRGVADPTRAQQNWILQCQGCHRPDARGDAATPALAGAVARFLRTAEGRAYLVRVPGVATATLDDEQLAELLNWALARFDSEHLAAEFDPYTAEEVAVLRRKPLRTEAASVRAQILAVLDN